MKTKITILLVILSSVCSFAQVGTEFMAGGLKYKITAATTAEVTVNPTTIAGTFSIPSTIIFNSINYQITGISDSAFSGCKSLTSITIPNTVTSIGRSAFNQCSGLTAVTIPNSVTSIGDFIFNQCSSLVSVIISESITNIGRQAFSGCSSLTMVFIPSSVSTIGLNAFNGCISLSLVGIPNSVTSIGSGAFAGCRGLITVTIPNSVTNIGEGAFDGCSNLNLVTVNWTIPLSINSNVFRSLENIATMTLYVPAGTETAYKTALVWKNFQTISQPSSGSVQIGEKFSVNGINYFVRKATLPYEVAVDKNINFVGTASIPATVLNNGISFVVSALGSSAFERSTSLTSISIPNSITNVGAFAFQGCTGLTSIIIPNNLKSLGDSAFGGCVGLTSIVIPNTVTSIGQSVFAGCRGLTSITLSSSLTNISAFAFNNCISLTSVTIPSSVTNIGDFAFAFSGLTTVNIPSSVTSININAFASYGSLTSVTVNWLTPISINLNVFGRVSTTTLNVPAGTEAAYKAAPVWKDFGTIATLSTNDFAIHNKQKFYPNPAQSQINFLQEINRLEVFDIRGRKVKSFENPSKTFDVSNLEKGIYVLKGLSTEGKFITQKLVKD